MQGFGSEVHENWPAKCWSKSGKKRWLKQDFKGQCGDMLPGGLVKGARASDKTQTSNGEKGG